MTTAQEIKALRQTIGLTQAQIARALGVTEQTVYSWERGTASPSRFDEIVILRMRELARTAAGRAQIHEAVMKAQYMPPAPSAAPKSEGVIAGDVLAIGVGAFGLGVLLGALFASGEGKKKKKPA